MRFFQSESHSKPDDKNDDNATGAVRSDPVPVPRSSDENDVTDGGTHRVPAAAGADAADADRDGRADDSSARTGEPVDADVVPDAHTAPDAAGTRRDDQEPVFVEPVPQETAFGAATVGGAVAASELAARRETDAPHTVPAEPVDAFGTPVSTGSATRSASDFDGVDQAPHDFGRSADASGGDPARSPDEAGHAAQSPHEWGRAADDPAQEPHDFGRAGEPDGSPSEAGRGQDGTDGDRAGFGPADRHDSEQAEGFGPAGAAGTGKPLRAEGLTATEGFGSADADERAHPHTTEATALGVAAGAAAGAAVAGAAIRNKDRSTDDRDRDGRPGTIATDRDGDGRPDTGGTSADRDGDGRPDTGTAAKDRDGDGWPDAEPIVNDRDGDGRLDDEPTGAAATAAVPIEPIPTPADAKETPATVDEPVELLPGDVPEQPALAAFFSAGAAGDFRDRWREVQLRFVDDPAQAASDAGTLIDEVVAALNAAITEQREALGGTTTGQGDTEQLRVLVRRQRDFLDRILGL